MQLLSEIHTDIHARVLMTMLMFLVTAVVPLSFVLTARLSWTLENLPVIISGSFIFSATFIVIVFGFGRQAGVWSDSRAMFKKFDSLNTERYQKLTRRERKWQQRFWNSCRSLVKIKFGINYYMEEHTPLNCLNCSASLAAQLLLLVH